jgi:hypothetical protein
LSDFPKRRLKQRENVGDKISKMGNVRIVLDGALTITVLLGVLLFID